MDKLVYLHELDSVRRSADEIDAARRALYEEIVTHGNTVVITFNQLADSKAFLGLVAENDDILEAIKGLMLDGAIKISRYNDKRTASQYLQDNLQPTPSGSHGKFVLSGWGIPNELTIEEREIIRDSIYRALRNSDTDYLELKRRKEGDDLSDLCEPGKTITAKQYNDMLDRMERLVNLMLAISNSTLSYVDVNTAPYPTFEAFLDRALEAYPALISPEALALIEETREALTEGERRNRSPYYRLLEETGASEGTGPSQAVAEEATRVLDLCYNLTTEASIRGVSGHYDARIADSVDSEFAGRLESYQRAYDERAHVYPWVREYAEAEREPNATLPEWEHALRIRKAASWHAPKRPSANTSLTEGGAANTPLYEARLETDLTAWRARVRRALTRNILIMVLYAVILSFVEVIISLVQDLMVGLMNLGNDTISDMVSEQGSLISIVIFLAGILIFARAHKKNRRRNRRILIGFLAVLFIIVLPLLSCIDISFGGDGFAIEANLGSLPEMLAMGIPNLIASFIGVALFAYIGWLLEEKLNMPGIIDSAEAALSSTRDLVAFAARKPLAEGAYINEHTREHTTAKVRETDPTDAPFASKALWHPSRTGWEQYLEAVADDGPSADDEPLRVIKDHAAVLEFERQLKGKPIGIAYSSPYTQMIVDLVEDASGDRFAYERIIPTNKGAVVIVPVWKGRYVLLRQFRHALRTFQMSFPRGYGEADISAGENAAKELFEELGVKPLGKPTRIGTVIADSGLSGNAVAVYICDIPEPKVKAGYEGIEGYETFSTEELDAAVKAGKITDGFTLSALTLLRCNGWPIAKPEPEA